MKHALTTYTWWQRVWMWFNPAKVWHFPLPCRQQGLGEYNEHEYCGTCLLEYDCMFAKDRQQDLKTTLEMERKLDSLIKRNAK